MIKKNHVSTNYTVLSNTIINSELSAIAKAMMQYLLSKPENWVVKVWDLRKNLQIGRNKTYNTITELKQAG